MILVEYRVRTKGMAVDWGVAGDRQKQTPLRQANGLAQATGNGENGKASQRM